MEILPQLPPPPPRPPPPPPPPRLRTCRETQTARAGEGAPGPPASPSLRVPGRGRPGAVTGEGAGRKLASRAPEARADAYGGSCGERTLAAGPAASPSAASFGKSASGEWEVHSRCPQGNAGNWHTKCWNPHQPPTNVLFIVALGLEKQVSINLDKIFLK
ncbi:formin-like protein 5 isoform X2 [Octodon degus]|uniref:Formin-like protein 5 isoform X2 n=1 Tax=Octodon degus TaxID=10160 RepID=A0A6P6F0Q9_OCTDE|nr:formin-like protein 5 isoform X2 [Octodon degus]